MCRKARELWPILDIPGCGGPANSSSKVHMQHCVILIPFCQNGTCRHLCPVEGIRESLSLPNEQEITAVHFLFLLGNSPGIPELTCLGSLSAQFTGCQAREGKVKMTGVRGRAVARSWPGADCSPSIKLVMELVWVTWKNAHWAGCKQDRHR